MKKITGIIAATVTGCLSMMAQTTDNKTDMGTSKTLVVYFSATGTTAEAARGIAGVTGGTLHEIVPEIPYTDADLDWNDRQSRSSVEMADKKARPALKYRIEDMADCDTVFIGYPIWWNLAPRIINTFIESHDLEGKVVIPFATSGGSGISNSVSVLEKTYPDLMWKEGKLLNDQSPAAIREWIKGL